MALAGLRSEDSALGATTSAVGSSGEPPPSVGELRRRSLSRPLLTGAKTGWLVRALGGGRSGEVAGRGDSFEALGGGVEAVGVGKKCGGKAAPILLPKDGYMSAWVIQCG